MSMEDLFQKYKDISLAVISAVDSDNLDSMDKLILERGKVLKLISDVGAGKEELKKLYEKYDLFNIDREIEKKFKHELNDLREKIDRVKMSKKASKSYNKVDARAVFLSRKM